jgi:hypothetical protein
MVSRAQKLGFILRIVGRFSKLADKEKLPSPLKDRVNRLQTPSG